MKSIIPTLLGIVLGTTIVFGSLWLMIDYFPGKAEIDDSWQYKYINQLMESDDAKHYWPTLEKAMEDGKIQNFEYDRLMEIEYDLSFILRKAELLELWILRREQWKTGDFSKPNNSS